MANVAATSAIERAMAAQHFLRATVPDVGTGSERVEGAMGGTPQRLGEILPYPTTKEGAMSYLGFGPAPKYAERSALQNRIG